MSTTPADAEPCLVCGGTEHDVLYPSTYSGSVEQAPHYFLAHRTATAHGRIVRCRACGFVFTSPRFSDGEYDEIYKSIPSPARLDPSFARANRARLSRLAGVVRKHAKGQPELLDFGCGDGSFLEVLASPAARGFEIGAPGTRRAGPSEIITGDWSQVAGSPAIPAGSFDVVTAFDVLEHLPRIKQDLASIHAVLKPGGLFFASVPNIASWIARAMGPRWTMLLLEHLWYFSPATMRRFMAAQGFHMLEWRGVPYDAPLSHLTTRVLQVFGQRGTWRGGAASQIVLPVPAGLMLGVFRRANPE